MGALLLPFTTAQRERLFNNRPANVGKGLALVGAATSAGARRAGVAAMEEQGKGWVRSAMSTVRLATAQDLGCRYTGAEGGAA